mgnify:CR=1 FL=1
MKPDLVDRLAPFSGLILLLLLSGALFLLRCELKRLPATAPETPLHEQ